MSASDRAHRLSKALEGIRENPPTSEEMESLVVKSKAERLQECMERHFPGRDVTSITEAEVASFLHWYILHS